MAGIVHRLPLVEVEICRRTQVIGYIVLCDMIDLAIASTSRECQEKTNAMFALELVVPPACIDSRRLSIDTPVNVFISVTAMDLT